MFLIFNPENVRGRRKMKEGNKLVDAASLFSPLEAGSLPATCHFEKGSTQHRPSLPAGAGRLPLPKPLWIHG